MRTSPGCAMHNHPALGAAHRALLLLLLPRLTAAVAVWSVSPVPTVTQPVRVTVTGAQFDVAARLVLVHTQGACNTSASALANVAPSGVSEIFWTPFDDPVQWAVTFTPPSGGGWAGFSSWGEPGRLFVCFNGEAIYSARGGKWFTVFTAEPWYTLSPPTPVGAPWATPLVITVRGPELASGEGMVTLTSDPLGCDRWPTPGVPGEPVHHGRAAPEHFAWNATYWDKQEPRAAERIDLPQHSFAVIAHHAAPEVYVCLSADGGLSAGRIPRLPSAGPPVPYGDGDGTWRTARSAPQWGFSVGADYRDPQGPWRVGGAQLQCGPIVAGALSHCSLRFYANGTGTIVLPHSDTLATDFDLSWLADGAGREVCPRPAVTLDRTVPEVVWQWTPQRPGRLGAARVTYRGNPVALGCAATAEICAADESWYDTPANASDPQWDPTEYRFVVDEPYADSTSLGSELADNGGFEELSNASQPYNLSSAAVYIPGWTNESSSGAVGALQCCGLWRVQARRPAAAWGTVQATPLSPARISQVIDLPTAADGETEYVSMAYFHPALYRTDPNFVISDPNQDARVLFTWYSGAAGTGTSQGTAEMTVHHVSGDTVRLSATFTSASGGVLTSVEEKAAASWLSLRDRRAPPVGTRSLHIAIEADPSRAAVVSFDSVTVRRLTRPRTPDSETQALRNLYTATGGATWASSERWLTGDPCIDFWQGVECHYARVVAIRLPRNNLRGEIPLGLLSVFDRLEELDLRGNALYGEIELGGNTSVELVDVSGNRLRALESPLPFCLRSLRAQRNRLEPLPALWGLSRIEVLELSQNRIAGPLPDDYFAGLSAPPNASQAERGASGALRYFSLARNRLSGPIPAGLPACCKGLAHLDLSYNRLNGTIPAEWESGGLGQLQELLLQHNLFEGALPGRLLQGAAAPGRLRIDVSHNLLDGPVPAAAAHAAEARLEGNAWACPLPDIGSPRTTGSAGIPPASARALRCDAARRLPSPADTEPWTNPGHPGYGSG